MTPFGFEAAAGAESCCPFPPALAEDCAELADPWYVMEVRLCVKQHAETGGHARFKSS